MWGDNSSGQCGIPGAENYREPTLVTALHSLEVLTLACGGNHTLFLTKCTISLSRRLTEI